MAWNGIRSALGGLLGGKPARGNAVTNTHYHITNPYHAVSIVPGAACCNAARELRFQRFLSKEAPPLPLASCTMSPTAAPASITTTAAMKAYRRASDRIRQPPPRLLEPGTARSERAQTDRRVSPGEGL